MEETPGGPAPKMAGRFTLYDTPDGGLHIVYQADGSEKSEHLEVPGPIIRASQMLQGMQDRGERITFKKMAGVIGPIMNGLT
jgi:hypothetical protein